MRRKREKESARKREKKRERYIFQAFNGALAKCHSVVLASGTLTPIDTFESELKMVFKFKMEGEQVRAERVERESRERERERGEREGKEREKRFTL